MPRSSFTKDDQGLMNNWAVEPKMYVDQGEERFGLTEYAEIINGRLAMVGMVGLVVVELLTGKSFLGLLGF
jgi:Chlorophyll A-B binding protein